MYTFWKRTVPPASLATFDAPDREKCAVRRSVTNTPLQALVLMNDPTYIEASRALAQRVLREAAPNVRSRASRVFRLITLRNPRSAELAIVQKLALQQLAHYQTHVEDAERLLSVGESSSDPAVDRVQLAAWTNVASVLFSMDESVTRE
jgi:hypothetical protein